MHFRLFAATACLTIATAGGIDARIADRDIEYIVSRNEATREQLGAVRYEIAQGAYLYESRPSGLSSGKSVRLGAPLGEIKTRKCVSMHKGTVVARGDSRAYEMESLIPGGDGVSDLHTHTLAIRNDRYFALSRSVIVPDNQTPFGDVYVYPHRTSVDGVPMSFREEQYRTADVLDYGFMADRAGQTLRREVERFLHPEYGGSVDLEVLNDPDGGLREYRLSLRGEQSGTAWSSVVYSIDPHAGFMIKRRETFDTNGHLMTQRRVQAMPLGETGLHFPAEVIETTFEMAETIDGKLPMPRTETLTVASDVELLRSLDARSAFGLKAFGLDEDSPVLVFDSSRVAHPTRMSVETAEALTADDPQERGGASRGPEHRRPSTQSGSAAPTATGGLLSKLWGFFSSLLGSMLR